MAKSGMLWAGVYQGAWLINVVLCFFVFFLRVTLRIDPDTFLL